MDVLRRFLLNLLTLLAGGAIVLGILTLGGRQDRLCSVIYVFVAKSDAEVGKPGSSSYEFFQRLRPRERRRAIDKAHKQSNELLEKLSYCKPDELPKAARAGTRDKPATPPRRARKPKTRDTGRDIPSPATPRVASTGTKATPPARVPRRPDQPARPPPAPPATVPPANLPGPGGPSPGQGQPPAERPTHGHEHSIAERACDALDGLLTNVC